MRRIALIALLLIGVPVALAVTLGASNGGGGSGYKVRVIFDNAGNVVPGEDLKIAGAKVGKVDSLDVTPDNKAAVTVEVDNAGFTPWHSDASCTVRPISGQAASTIISARYSRRASPSCSRNSLRSGSKAGAIQIRYAVPAIAIGTPKWKRDTATVMTVKIISSANTVR